MAERNRRDEILGREPMREAKRPEAPKLTMKNRPTGWDDVVEIEMDSADPLHIDPSQVPEGFSMRWVMDTCFGKSFPEHRSQAERNGWTPVDPTGDFDGKFAYLATVTGGKEIRRDGLCLMARPKELSDRSRLAERMAAAVPMGEIHKKLHGGVDVEGGDHISARKFNHVKRSIERLEIPEK
jgi:hypothetical protein